MKKAMALFFCVVLLFGCSHRSSATEGKVAPDFSLETVYRSRVNFSDYKNKTPVLLFFWTTWCPYCQEELKVLGEKYTALKSEGLQVLAIDAGESPARVERFVTSRGFTFPVLLDTDTTVVRSYKVYGVPTYVLISKEGRIVSVGNVFPSYYKSVLEKS
jgi:peroxiredoxin